MYYFSYVSRNLNPLCRKMTPVLDLRLSISKPKILRFSISIKRKYVQKASIEGKNMLSKKQILIYKDYMNLLSVQFGLYYLIAN
jgi:hypothetical protein